MRELKFRAWDSEASRWLEPHELMAMAIWGTGDENKGQLVYPSGIYLMQYTGLKDKNGVEIYEGDILSLAGSITGAEGMNPGFLFDDDDKVEIAWDADIAAWSIAGDLDRTDRVEVTYRNHVIQLIHQGACEVIGNIYENPELLEKE